MRISVLLLWLMLFTAHIFCATAQEKNGATICGTIKDDATLQPIRGAKVELLQAGVSVLTAIDGSFTIECPNINTGRYISCS